MGDLHTCYCNIECMAKEISLLEPTLNNSMRSISIDTMTKRREKKGSDLRALQKKWDNLHTLYDHRGIQLKTMGATTNSSFDNLLQEGIGLHSEKTRLESEITESHAKPQRAKTTIVA
eukprot:scaffold7264_cov168-Amphora_coffeaeformis.AAC.1